MQFIIRSIFYDMNRKRKKKKAGPLLLIYKINAIKEICRSWISRKFARITKDDVFEFRKTTRPFVAYGS